MGILNLVPATMAILGSAVDLNGSGHYVNWGWIHISVANVVVIGLMILVFVAAIAIPFRRHRRSRGS